MTRYWLDKSLRDYVRNPDFRERFNANAASALVPRELSAPEISALVGGDIRAIFKLGAHPFLVYSFAIERAGGWSFQMMQDYVNELEGVELGEIET